MKLKNLTSKSKKFGEVSASFVLTSADVERLNAVQTSDDVLNVLNYGLDGKAESGLDCRWDAHCRNLRFLRLADCQPVLDAFARVGMEGMR